MILFSTRQKQILLTLLNEKNGISLEEIEKQLHVSRRTLYREFSNIRLFLEQNDLILTSQNGNYILNGESTNKKRLEFSLKKQNSDYDLTTSQRQNAVAAKLLLDNEITKISSIAYDLNVSEGTIQHDLLTIMDSLKEYNLTVEKKKGVGVKIVGSEPKRRQVLCGILLSELNEYSFLRYLNDYDNSVTNFFMSLLPYDLLSECNHQLKKNVFSKINFSSDRQIISIVLMFAITIFRFTHGAKIIYSSKQSKDLAYLGITYKFFANFHWKKNYPVQQISKNEIIFLTRHIRNTTSNVNSYEFESDGFSVMVQVRELVELVSTTYGWDFRRNPQFFKRLSRHIENLIKNEQHQLPNVQIDTLQRVSNKYPRLFNTILTKWKEVFPNKNLTQPESQLLLLYFANEYTNRGYQRELRALVICENGFSTSQILKSRLVREVPEIQKIETTKVSDLYQIEPRNYDIILSTIDLPGFPRDYQVVSPLLLENDVTKIHNWLQTYQKKYSTVQEEPIPTENNSLVSPKILVEKGKEIYLYNQIVKYFCVKQIDNHNNELSLKDITSKIINEVPTAFISERNNVVNDLLNRINLAPIGIPDTNLVILHTSSKGVKKAFCSIFELQKPFIMQAMDQENILVNRMVLLLAPYDLDELTESTLGMISSLIIMNNDNTDLFENGETDRLRSFLTEKFLDAIKK
ncbi:HTH domain-containing protein [Ligilactobacillus pobuzihii]|uniref:BglG family transcription antiterminator n=1 Tax=Ligilactobacillus pobuzihii TaxID=449659 RepID=UPI0019D0B29A|nr:helix-turn-helix domain-containing protein [Ligilactobacillus pobuzihii]MBN7273871.1 HTH domain-containing protein [Ligilactobacillus pobuzihii]